MWCNIKTQKIMARRKSRAQLEAQMDRIERAINRRRNYGRYPENEGYSPTDGARLTRAQDAYVRYARNMRSSDETVPYSRSVYMGGRTSPAVTRDTPAGRTASARGVPRGITISQESLDAFRRRRDAAANGLNAG